MCSLTIKGKICSCFIEKGQKPIIFKFAAFLAASSSSLFSSRPEFRPDFFFNLDEGTFFSVCSRLRSQHLRPDLADGQTTWEEEPIPLIIPKVPRTQAIRHGCSSSISQGNE